MDEHPLRVVLVSPVPPPTGGIATWTEVLLDALGEEEGVAVRHIDVGASWRRFAQQSRLVRFAGGILQAAWDLARVIAALAVFRPDVLHLTSSAGPASIKDLAMMWLSRLFGAKGVLHYHTSRVPGDVARGGFCGRVTASAMRAASAVFVLDESTQRFVSALPGLSHAEKVPNPLAMAPIDRELAAAPARTSTRTQQATRFGFLGRVLPEKGLVELVEACGRLEECELHVIGPVAPSFAAALEERAGGGSWLTLHGVQDRAHAYCLLLACDVLVLPSHAEAFPYAVLEAMALGKPVVVSDVGAMPEMIGADSDTPCGLCVTPRDVDSLFAALREIEDRSAEWPELGERARKRVETHYAAPQVARRLRMSWTTLAGGSRAA